MNNIGIVEGFFGPPWNKGDRESYAPFLAKYKANFYIYAPKKDQHLRKLWREDWSAEYLLELTQLKDHFQSHQIKFGIGFSPFGLGDSLSLEDKDKLKEKCQLLSRMKIDILGLFFDDMKSNENLAEIQLAAFNEICTNFKGQIIFCPTFYSFDPLLEKVFGKMPDGYLEKISNKIPSEINIAWTGPKVISNEIETNHLEEVKKLLKRKPFIWENLFANDGPRNFKFLKLKPFTGRDSDITKHTNGYAFNLMNQAQLSKISFLSSILVLRSGFEPIVAFEKALDELCSKELKDFIFFHRDEFLVQGLDNITEDQRHQYLKELKQFNEPCAIDIINWLNGQYIVDADCLTD